jgi:hypothetical protein
VKGSLPAELDLGLAGTDMILNARDFEGLKLACHAGLEELRTRVSQGLSRIGNVVGSGRVPPNKFGGRILKASGTPAANELAVFTAPNLVKGDSNLTWDDTSLNVTLDLSVARDVDITGDFDQGGPGPPIGTFSLAGGAFTYGASTLYYNAASTFGSAITFTEGFGSADLVTASADFGATNQLLLAQGANRQAKTSSITAGELVTYRGAPGLNQVAVFFDADTLESDSSFKYDGTTVTIDAVLNVIGNSSLDDTTFTGAVTCESTVDITGALSLDGRFNIGAMSGLTLASDAVTVTGVHHNINAQSGTTDDLATVNGGIAGDIIILRPAAGDTITVKHNTGNILTFSGADVAMSVFKDSMTFLFHGTKWYQIAGKT